MNIPLDDLTAQLANEAPTPGFTAPLVSLPVAALLARGDRIVAANPAYEALMAVPSTEVVGRSIADLIAQFVNTPDFTMVGAAAVAQQAGVLEDGHLWCRVIDGEGRPRSLRVVWEPVDDEGGLIIYLIEAQNEAAAKSLAEALARAGGDLGRCRDEGEVLERAADALFARGMTVTILLLREDDPLLAYGPTRSPKSSQGAPSAMLASLERARPSRDVLTQLNPDFYRRRAAFFQDLEPLVDAAYSSELAGELKPRLPSQRCVQAPIFVDGAAYGALVVTSNALSPALAGAIEMFAELMASAIENVRLHRRAAVRVEELERLQGELVRQERLAALGEAAAVMAHEVRNPIGAILNAIALLRRGTEPEGAMLHVIDEEAARLERMVSNLLDLGRPLAPRIQSVDLFSLASRSVDVLRARRECDGITVDVEEPPFLMLADVDPDLLQLALLNVIRNAAQASPPRGRVVVRIEDRGNYAAIFVDDEGQGFPEAETSRLFEPFFTTRATGTGIGLAVVRRVVEANRGTLEIARTPLGGGRLGMVFARDQR